jgi:hypothetical protein
MGTKDDAGLLTRRTALRGAAAVAGAAWLVPVVTVVSMDSASAASAPPPPSSGGMVGDPGHAVDPGDPADPGGSANSALAFTGSNTAEAAGAGLATLAVGAAAVTVAHKLRRKTEHPEAD